MSTLAGFMHMLHSDGYSLCASIEAGQWPLHALPEETTEHASKVTCPGCAEMLAQDAEKRLLACLHDLNSIGEVNGRPRWICRHCNEVVPTSYWTKRSGLAGADP